MYAKPNFKTKKALKEALAAGQRVTAFLPNSEYTGFTTQTDGETVIEGPHYPEPHRWYAKVMLKDGEIIKVLK